MSRLNRFVAAGLTVAPLLSHAGIFDDLNRLEGKAVIYAGEFESITCPIYGKIDCATWPMTMLKTTHGPELCVGSPKYVRCSFTCRGLIAVGEDKIPKAYVFGAMGSDATEVAIEKYRCPAPF
jgi:hypothetical protein